MPARNIPGFYFDESRRKYFKILPNHAAPQGYKYSQAALQKATEDEAAHTRLKACEERAIAQRIRRSKALTHPLCGGGGVGLGRESGVLEGGRPATLGAWAQGLYKRVLLKDTGTENSLFEYDDAANLYIVAHTVRADVADPRSIIR